MTERSVYILQEAASKGITDLVGIFSTSISVQAKRYRLKRIADDLSEAIKESLGAERVS